MRLMNRNPLRAAALMGSLALILALTACNLPAGGTAAPSGAAAAQTAAAQTVEAVLATPSEQEPATQAPASPTPPSLPQTPVVQAPTQAVPVTPSATPRPCNQASFVADVTVPDGSVMPPGNNFTKVWRLKNVGTCSWTTNYALVFDSGEQMGGPLVQQLTTVVNPGETVDIAVDLTAPGAPGAYRGYWRLRDAGGNNFGLMNNNAFWVDIKVEPAAPTSTPLVLVPLPIPTFVIPVFPVSFSPVNSGAVTSDGGVIHYPNVGDDSSNAGLQAFITFDLSSIPAGSTISQVQVDFSNFDTVGDPFGSLGCLRMYSQNYGNTIDSGDYFGAPPIGALARWCSEGELGSAFNGSSALIAYLEGQAGGMAQFRLQFNDLESDFDNVADVVRFADNIQITITYTAP